MEEIVHIIQNVGFPIVACIYMAKQNKEITTSISKLNETLIGIDKRIEYMEKEIKKNDRHQEQ